MLRPRSGGFATNEVATAAQPPAKQQHSKANRQAMPDIYQIPDVQQKQVTGRKKQPLKQTNKLDLYKNLGNAKQDYQKAKEMHITEKFAKDRAVIESGRDLQHEQFAAAWQGYLANHKYIEQAMSDGHIDPDELRQINNLEGLSREDRDKVLRKLEIKYGPVGMEFDKEGNEYVAVEDPDWIDPDRAWPAPSGPRDKPGFAHSAAASSTGSNASTRPPTPDHFEDDGGLHDEFRKQVRGIGKQLAGEYHQQRKHLQAAQVDRRKLVPEGATAARNQYKLLMTPRNRNFLSQLGLNPEISRHLPATRADISKLYSKLDRVGVGFVPTTRIYEHFRTTGMRISKTDAERLVQLCDTNSDGYVQKMDLINALQKLQPMIGVEMCMPSAVAQQNNMVKGLLKESEEEMAKMAVGEKPEGPQEVLDEVFTPRVGTKNISRHIGRRQVAGANVITPGKNTALYSGPAERFMTAHTQMCLQTKGDYKTPEQLAKLRKSKQYFVKLDMMHERLGALEYRAREKDMQADWHETDRIKNKKEQLERYTAANLVGADLFDRMQAKHRNRLRVMSRSPHLQQTFDIFNRGDPSKQQQRLKDWDAGKIVDAARYEHD